MGGERDNVGERSTKQYTGSTQPPTEPSLAPQDPTAESQKALADANPPPSSHTDAYSHGFDQSGFPLSSDPQGLHSSPSSPRLGPTHRSTLSLVSEANSPSRLKVRDLAHIQSFASQEYLNRGRLAGRILDSGKQFEISSMPVADIIEMVAGLLTRITNTNDRQHDHIHRPASNADGTPSSQGQCVLAFHGKNVPSITILSYLSRIHKYCPTTYEVFLSLLVYFDRMTDNFNKNFLQNASERQPEKASSNASSVTLTDQEPFIVDEAEEESDDGQFFVVDSYNIHRLVIAGVTCASKFFSDVFYTNSRYAKVRIS
ncbi:hypothetical protein BT93_L5454 [Corymbia citriodora subsp. variegata]|uniref:Uncharacterized protein n=1 Tax=Corymbia citriodora subsp. variegata TaxID=360336 RepID=A0A8T0CF69_CORYI|nr:hypothetical protein BT93_L5454 [Corymbia citriodora subsp. variegata]